MTAAARILGIAVLVAACSGCLPAIAHGPRVEPGTSIGLTASLTKGPGFPDGDGEAPFLLGPLGLNFGAGWGGGRPGEPGARVGLHFPVPLVLFPQGDVYVQLPAGTLGALDGGIGLSALLLQPSAMTMPYLQLGRIGEGGSGWYTTQGVLLQSESANDLWGEAVGLAWMPALAYQRGSHQTTTHLFVAGALALRQCGSFCDRDSGRWVLATGMTLEFHRRPAPAARR